MGKKCAPEDEDAAAVVVALRLDVGVGHEEDGKDDRDDIPAREDKSVVVVRISTPCIRTIIE